MSVISMVVTVVAITPLITYTLVTLWAWFLAILSFINNLLLSIFTLMWILIQVLSTWIHTTVFAFLSPFNSCCVDSNQVSICQGWTFSIQIGPSLTVGDPNLTKDCLLWPGALDYLLLLYTHL